MKEGGSHCLLLLFFAYNLTVLVSLFMSWIPGARVCFGFGPVVGLLPGCAHLFCVTSTLACLFLYSFPVIVVVGSKVLPCIVQASLICYSKCIRVSPFCVSWLLFFILVSDYGISLFILQQCSRLMLLSENADKFFICKTSLTVIMTLRFE